MNRVFQTLLKTNYLNRCYGLSIKPTFKINIYFSLNNIFKNPFRSYTVNNKQDDLVNKNLNLLKMNISVKDFSTAKNNISEILSVDPNNYEALYYKSTVELLNQENEKSIETARRTIQLLLSPSYQSQHTEEEIKRNLLHCKHLLGSCLMSLDRYEEVAEIYKEIFDERNHIEGGPTNDLISYTHNALISKDGYKSKIFEFFTTLVNNYQFVCSPSISMSLGIAEFIKGDVNRALNFLNQGLNRLDYTGVLNIQQLSTKLSNESISYSLIQNRILSAALTVKYRILQKNIDQNALELIDTTQLLLEITDKKNHILILEIFKSLSTYYSVENINRFKESIDYAKKGLDLIKTSTTIKNYDQNYVDLQKTELIAVALFSMNKIPVNYSESESFIFECISYINSAKLSGNGKQLHPSLQGYCNATYILSMELCRKTLVLNDKDEWIQFTSKLSNSDKQLVSTKIDDVEMYAKRWLSLLEEKNDISNVNFRFYNQLISLFKILFSAVEYVKIYNITNKDDFLYSVVRHAIL